MTESEGSLSRRDFIKQAGIIAGGTIIAGCVPKSDVDMDSIPVTDTRSATPPPTVPTETLTPSVTPEVWRLSLSQRVELMREPEFFTELQGENIKKIITLQFDENEYLRLDRKVFSNNCCGESTLATIVKMCEFLNTGKVSDVTIADIITTLDGATFTDIKGYTAEYIVWDDSMYLVGLADALKTLAPELISKAEFLTPNYGARYTRIVPQSKWPDVLSKAQAVCEDGGFVIIGCLKHSGGHILFGTDVREDGTAIIVDSYSGIAQRILLKNYLGWCVDPEAKFLGKQPGLLNMIGITPSLSASS